MLNQTSTSTINNIQLDMTTWFSYYNFGISNHLFVPKCEKKEKEKKIQKHVIEES